MKIALIDTGVDKNIKREDILEHYVIKNGVVKKSYRRIKENHGTECCTEILNHSKCKDIRIYDFNVWNSDGTIDVDNIVAGIKRAIQEKVDMINISLGVTESTKELSDVCKEALENNIIIVSAASHRDTISFPADYKTVISVKVDQKQKEVIKLVDDNTVSISMLDYIIEDKGEKFDFSSSSMAAARVTGILSNDLDSDFITDSIKILYKKYGVQFSTQPLSNDMDGLEEEEENVIYKDKIAVVLFPQKQLDKIRDFRIDNIVAYYDFGENQFKSFETDEETSDFDSIYLINTMYNDVKIPKDLSEKFKGYKINYLGNFMDMDTTAFYRKYENYKSNEMSVLEKPVIAIASLCSESNKIDIQNDLYARLKKDELEVQAVSNNPLGLAQGMDVFQFPDEINFPNIVYEINRFMYIQEKKKDMDLWLINIGGAIGPVNGLNLYRFGKLADAYMSAANVDLLVLCINPSVDIERLEYELGTLYRNGVEKIYLVLSGNDIDGSTMDYKDGLQTYSLDKEKYKDALKYIRKNVRNKVFSMEEAESGILYDEIINALT